MSHFPSEVFRPRRGPRGTSSVSTITSKPCVHQTREKKKGLEGLEEGRWDPEKSRGSIAWGLRRRGVVPPSPGTFRARARASGVVRRRLGARALRTRGRPPRGGGGARDRESGALAAYLRPASRAGAQGRRPPRPSRPPRGAAEPRPRVEPVLTARGPPRPPRTRSAPSPPDAAGP